MTSKVIYWNGTAGDKLTVSYPDRGDGTITVSSDPNNTGGGRSKTLTVKTTAGNSPVTKTIAVSQNYSPAPTGGPTEGPTDAPTPTPEG
jgi:hypothetical protein